MRTLFVTLSILDMLSHLETGGAGENMCLDRGAFLLITIILSYNIAGNKRRKNFFFLISFCMRSLITSRLCLYFWFYVAFARSFLFLNLCPLVPCSFFTRANVMLAVYRCTSAKLPGKNERIVNCITNSGALILTCTSSLIVCPVRDWFMGRLLFN